MPRPEIEAIGTKYRRIPILAIGRDIYNDTRLILSKLEELYPHAVKSISAEGPEQKAIERLLQHWAVDNGLFMRAAQLIPRHLPLMRDEKFLRDRKELTGRSVCALPEQSVFLIGLMKRSFSSQRRIRTRRDPRR